MAAIEPAGAIVPLSELTAGTSLMLDDLVAQSGWNQTTADWKLFARRGHIYVARNDAGVIVASGAVLPFDSAIAWISMILVMPALRGHGLGSAMFRHCLQTVQTLGRAACLDATPAGERVYRRFGFHGRFSLTRWERSGPPPSAGGGAPCRALDLRASAATLDARAMGAQREAILGDLMSRPGSVAMGEADAFALRREGRLARHIGPVLARDSSRAIELTESLLPRTGGEAMFIDTVEDADVLTGVLQSSGFRAQRSFLRMTDRPDFPAVERSLMHASAGPEYG